MNFLFTKFLTLKEYFANKLSIVLLFWLAWLIFPLFNSGFISDDAYSSQIKGIILTSDSSIFDRIYSEISYWSSLGRFNPLNWIFWYTYFYLFPSLILFKTLVFVIIYFNLIYFRRILEHIVQSKSFSYSVVFLVPILFQFRYWHDPILAFASIPLACLFFFLSLNFLIQYLQAKKKLFYFYFIVIFIFSLLSYEISYISPIFYFLIAYLNNKSFKKSLILIILPTFLVFTHLIFRLNYEPNINIYPSVVVSTDFVLAINALIIQLISTIPFSWKFAQGFNNLSFLEIDVLDLIVPLIISIIFAGLINSQIVIYKSVEKYRIKFLILFSLLLIILPALVVAISGHQSDIVNAGIGYGYLLVFFQYFGLAVFLFLIISRVKNSSVSIVIIFITIFSIVSITRLENYHVVNQSNLVYKYPRDLLRKSLESGLLDTLKSNDLIIRDEKYPSDHFSFYSMIMKKNVNVCSINVSSDNITISDHEIADQNRKYNFNWYKETKFPFCLTYKKWDKIYGLSYRLSSDHKSGQVLLAPLEIIDKNQTHKRFKFKDYKIFNSLDNQISEFNGDIYYDFNKVRGTTEDISLDENRMKSFMVDEVSLTFLSFYPEERSERDYLRWSTGDSKIIIINDTKRVQDVTLVFSVVRPDNNSLKIKIIYQGNLIGRVVNLREDFSISLSIQPGETKIRVVSDGEIVDNGDPRNIVFGLLNYDLVLKK